MIRILIISAILTILMSCQSNKKTNHVNDIEVHFKNLIQEKYSDNYRIYPSVTNQYSIVASKTKKFSEMGFDIDFFIFDHTEGRIIHEDFLKSGHVEWIDKFTIKAVDRKLEDQARQKIVYTFNANSREKIIE